MHKYEMTIDGRSVSADRYEEIRNPSTGAVVGLAPVGTLEHLEQAIAAATKAFAKWRQSWDSNSIRRGWPSSSRRVTRA